MSNTTEKKPLRKYKLNDILESRTNAEYKIIMLKFERAGISKATISRVRNVLQNETFSPTDHTLSQICDVLNTTTDDIKNSSNNG